MSESPKYLSCAETAKALRVDLKRSFPGVKFSVRSSVYSGGASIDVRWTGGPSRGDVEKVAKGYEGAGFDGMIDMKYNVRAWQLPDGRIVFASTSGTEGSRGMVPSASAPAPHPDAVLVDPGADYVFCQRDPAPGAPPSHDCMDHMEVYGGGWRCAFCAGYAEPKVEQAPASPSGEEVEFDLPPEAVERAEAQAERLISRTPHHIVDVSGKTRQQVAAELGSMEEPPVSPERRLAETIWPGRFSPEEEADFGRAADRMRLSEAMDL